MKPAPFTYERAEQRAEVDEHLRALGDEAKILAGGQSLLPVLCMRLAAPAHLVDVNHLRHEPDAPVREGDRVLVGPIVRMSAVERSPLVDQVAGLRETIAYVAHPAIRSRGTLVGSIAHADPSAEMPALLVALGGDVVARSHRGRRVIAAADLFVSHLLTSLEPDEWLEHVRLPVRRPDRRVAIREVARRHGDYAMAGAVATAERTGAHVDVVITLFGVAGVPTPVPLGPLSAAELLAPDLVDRVAELAADRYEPEDDLHASAAFRAHLAANMGAQAARAATEQVIG